MEHVVIPEDIEEVASTEEAITPEQLEDSLLAPDTTGSARATDMATQSVMIQGKATDTAAINLALAEFDVEASVTHSSDTMFSEIEQELSKAGNLINELSPDQVTAGIQTIVAGQELVNEMRNSPVSNELAVIQSASKTNLPTAIKNELAFALAVRNDITKMLDAAGMGDTVANIGGNFVPFRMANDYGDLKTAIKEHPELKNAISGDSITSMIGTWQSLPLKRRKVLIKPLTEAILAATGVDYSFGLGIPFLKSDSNVLNAAGILISFLEPEGGERASAEVTGFTAVDIAGFVPVGAIARALSVTTKLAKVQSKTMLKISKLSPTVQKDMAGIMGNAGEWLRKKNNPVKLVAEAGDTTQAAKINLTAMQSDEVARAYGLPSDVAYNNAMPKNTSPMTPGFIKGLAADTAKVINKTMSEAQGFTRSMTSESDLFTSGALSKSDRKLVVRSFYDEMDRKTEDLLQEGIHLTDVKILDDTSQASGFTYEFVLTNERAAESFINIKPKTHTAFRSWRINEVTGNFEETAISLAKGKTVPGSSPSSWSKLKAGEQIDFHDSVKQSIQLEDVAVARKQRLNVQWVEANKDISGLFDIKSRARIESIELAGDEFINKGTTNRGRMFTQQELVSGIHTKDGTIRLTKQNEVEAYYKRRIFADNLWEFQNYITRREYQLGGFTNSVNLKGQRLAVKPFDTVEGAKASSHLRPGYKVHIANSDATVLLTDDLIDAQYLKGRVLVRSRNDWNVSGAGDMASGGEVVEYLFIDKPHLHGLPDQVMHYKAGYVPKINEGIEFVVKHKLPVSKAGVKGATTEHALRAFNSRIDADKFKQLQIDKFVAKNPGTNPKKAELLFEVADGSQMAQMERMESALSGSGGLFTGTRSADDLLMGLDGVPIERMSPTGAFGRYIDHLGNALTRNEWRIGQEKNWLNTVTKLDGAIEVKGFNGTVLPNTPEGKALDRMRNQLNIWNRVPSRQESMFEGMIQGAHDWMLNGSAARRMGLSKNAINSALWLKHADPISAALTANMHVMLGAMAPVQLYVQASAAVVALSLARIRDIPGIIKNTAHLTVLDNIRNVKTADEVIKMWGATAKETELFVAWRRSGLLESVRSNADMNYMSSTGLGITNDFMRKASNVSLMIYRAGELTNRRISFTSAFTDWRLKNPTRKIDDDAMEEIVGRANLTMLELNAANKAWWQGGTGTSATQRVLSMTGQFQQVLAKTVELSVKGAKHGGFTRQQKSRIATGQLLVFGAAGVPLLNIVAPAMMDALGIEDTEGSIGNAINQGAVGVMVKEIFGADIDVANRAALYSSTFETMKEILTSKDPLWTKLLAVTGSTGQRVGEAIADISMVSKSQALTQLQKLEPLMIHNRASESDMLLPTVMQTAGDIARILGRIPSSGRNLLKARMMRNAGRIFDRRGRTVIDRSDKGGFSFNDQLGVAFGFRLSAETRLREVQAGNRHEDEVVQEAVQVIIKSYHDYVYLHGMKEEYAQGVRNVQQLIHEGIDNEYLIEKINNAVSNQIFTDPKSVEERELLKFFQRTATERLVEGVILDTTLGLNPSNIFNKQAIVQPFADTIEDEE